MGRLGNTGRPGAMLSDHSLLDLDYLVFSSHKTGTQTIRNSLRASGYKAAHCHQVSHLDLEDGDFSGYLEAYFARHGKPLDVITLFREPIDRHISSFFQGYGSRPLNEKEVADKTGTLIYKLTVEELREQFVAELEATSLIGFSESLHDIARELRLNLVEAATTSESGMRVIKSQTVRIFLARFELFFRDFEASLSRITGADITVRNSNQADAKWYREKYLNFRRGLELPHAVIEGAYLQKRDLIELLYDESFEAVLQRGIAFYGSHRGIKE